jgi:hypothetical protein
MRSFTDARSAVFQAAGDCIGQPLKHRALCASVKPSGDMVRIVDRGASDFSPGWVTMHFYYL